MDSITTENRTNKPHRNNENPNNTIYNLLPCSPLVCCSSLPLNLLPCIQMIMNCASKLTAFALMVAACVLCFSFSARQRPQHQEDLPTEKSKTLHKFEPKASQ